jgi:cyclopropane fatty-acyl-phospholipid synthase-like methyltransferase
MVPGYDRAKNARAQELYRMTTSSSTFMATDGDGYELTMGRWSRRLALPFLDFAGTKDGETVLDVGCGTGSLAFALTKRCPRSSVRGVDFSPPMLTMPERKTATLGWPSRSAMPAPSLFPIEASIAFCRC